MNASTPLKSYEDFNDIQVLSIIYTIMLYNDSATINVSSRDDGKDLEYVYDYKTQLDYKSINPYKL